MKFNKKTVTMKFISSMWEFPKAWTLYKTLKEAQDKGKKILPIGLTVVNNEIEGFFLSYGGNLLGKALYNEYPEEKYGFVNENAEVTDVKVKLGRFIVTVEV